MMTADALFSRHLDIAPLRGRRRGLVKCPFHPDKTPSFSVDLDREVFHCFGCGVGGGVKRFAELVGELVEHASPSRRPSSPLAEARARVRAEGERQRRRLEPYRDLCIIAAYLHRRFQALAEARRVAMVLGPTERGWEILDLAARVERKALAVEAELDDSLPLPWQQDHDVPIIGGRSA